MKKISFNRAAHDRIHRETKFARHIDCGESIQPAEPFATGIISGSRNRSNGRIRTQLEVSAAEASGTETRNAAEAPASPTDEATVPSTRLVGECFAVLGREETSEILTGIAD